MTLALTISTDLWNDLASEHGEHMRANYSGRGMYGQECLAYTGPTPTLFALDLAVALTGGGEWTEYPGDDVDDVRQTLNDIGEPLVDSMGLGTIVHYWPRITVADGSKPDDDDD